MIKEAIGTGATIEEAKEQAVAILGAGVEDDIEIEVLATPKKKTLGLFGGSPAKVRVFMEVPDPKPVPVKKPVPKPDSAKTSGQDKRPATQKKKEESRTAVSSQPAKQTRPAQDKKPTKETTKQEQNRASKPAPTPRTLGPAVSAAEVDPHTPPGRAAAYLQKLFTIMELHDVTMTISPIEGGSQIDLTGDGLGVIIGRRGETLDALQYLASLAANSGEGGFYRLVLNTGNYREKREQTLQSLARRMAAQVLRTGRNRTLEPMNPYERRIIHTTVQTIDGVVSNSIGDGASRRVVISPDRENGAGLPRERTSGSVHRSRSGRPGFRDYREGGDGAASRGGEDSRPARNRSEIEAFEAKAAGKSVILPARDGEEPAREPAEAVAPSVTAPVKQDAGNAPLYGRIDKKEE